MQFFAKFGKIICWCPPEGWRPLLLGILDLSLSIHIHYLNVDMWWHYFAAVLHKMTSLINKLADWPPNFIKLPVHSPNSLHHVIQWILYDIFRRKNPWFPLEGATTPWSLLTNSNEIETNLLWRGCPWICYWFRNINMNYHRLALTMNTRLMKMAVFTTSMPTWWTNEIWRDLRLLIPVRDSVDWLFFISSTASPSGNESTNSFTSDSAWQQNKMCEISTSKDLYFNLKMFSYLLYVHTFSLEIKIKMWKI